MSKLENAIELAVKAHKKGEDKNQAPYILHLLRVMGRVQSDTEKIVAVLHDIVEDTSYTVEDLKKKGYSNEIVEAVDCLTKKGKGNTYYKQYLKSCKNNSLARRVKIADLEDNMDIRRYKLLKPSHFKLLKKYLNAWHYLTKEED